MTVYNVAIIGLGIMGRRMLTAMTAHDRFHVGGVWDPDSAQFAAATAAPSYLTHPPLSNRFIAALRLARLGIFPVDLGSVTRDPTA